MAKRKQPTNGQKVAQPAATRKPLPPYPPSLCAGAPYDVDDSDDPERGGIYGMPRDIAPWTEDTVVTDFMRRSYDWQIECWDRECRELLAKYGCGIDPRDPMPAPLPDEATEIERDAYRLIRAVGGLKKHFRAGDYFAAIVFAVDLGSLKRKLQSRWADKLVDRGAKHVRTTNQMKSSREEKCGHPAENRACAAAHFDRLHNQHPKWKKDRIVRQISKSLRLSERHIWRLLRAAKRKKN